MQKRNLTYKSDFKITEKCDAGYAMRFRFLYYVGSPAKAYVACFDGENFENCHLNEDGTLTVCFDDHGLGIGTLMVERRYYFDDEQYQTGKCDVVMPAAPVVIIDKDSPNPSKLFEVVLSTKGLSYLECYAIVEPYWMLGGFGEAAYANEEQRKANEAERVEAENNRVIAENKRQSDWLSWFSDIKTEWGSWFTSAKSEVSSWFSSTKAEVASWFSYTKSAWNSWYNENTAAWASWFESASTAFATWFGSTKDAWSAWFDGKKDEVAKWFTDTKNEVATWFTGTKNEVASWFSCAQSAWDKWFGDTKTDWGTWFNNTTSAWTTWFDARKGDWSTWFEARKTEWTTWISDTKTEWATLKSDAIDATTSANNAAASANTATDNANAATAAANKAKTDCDAAAQTAIDAADTAKNEAQAAKTIATDASNINNQSKVLLFEMNDGLEAQKIATQNAETAAASAQAAAELASKAGTSIMIRPTGMSVDVPKVVPVGATAMVEVSMSPESSYASKVFQSKKGCFVAPDGSAEFTEIGTAVFYVVPTLNDTIAKKVEVTVRALESLQAENGTEITMEDGSTFEI